MTLHFDTGWMLAVILVSIRVASALAFTPVLGPTTLPGSTRVVLALALGALLVAVLPVAPVMLDLSQALVAAGAEIMVGASLAFGFLVAYAATQWAGRVLDVQMGFGAANVLNPDTKNLAPLLGTLLGMLAVAVFLTLDGHHVLIRALGASLRTFPPGSAGIELDWERLFDQSRAMFTFGLALAGPVMIALLLADVGMAVISRSMPQLNVFVLSFSVKVMLGLVGLAASIASARSALTALYESTFRYWAGMTAGP